MQTKGAEVCGRRYHRYRVIDAEALVERIQAEFVERVKTIEGLVAYYVVDGGDGTVTSITLGETEAAVAIRPWSRKIGSGAGRPPRQGAPDVTEGEVRVRTEALIEAPCATGCRRVRRSPR